MLLILVCAFTIMSCTKDDDGTTGSLPPLTIEGKNTFGCLIDGVLFLPRDKGAWVPPQLPVLSARYTYIPAGTEGMPAGYHFSLYAVNEFTSARVAIEVNAFDEPLAEGQTYP